MLILDIQATTFFRKRQLATLIAAHLQSKGHEAEVVTGNHNESGHRDHVIVRDHLVLPVSAYTSLSPCR